ncbi:MAG TPA: helix-hairpin-helix domain-containing protein [Chitinophagaceae bacterium]|nr:helix-hairpin-helix domain-containing protein [Chitinophagaceae bacterium]HNF70907.1 helix-hairpin-helix domain-containing protein [Chitinophagaceae bacterium]
MSNIRTDWQFSRAQRIAIYVLLFIILFLQLLRYLIRQYIPESDWKESKMTTYRSLIHELRTQNTQALHPFFFDPNTISEDSLLKMGLRPRLVQTWMNYRNKGGHFYTREGVERIYGMRKEEYRQLYAFIKIPGKNQPGECKLKLVELNSADTSSLIALPGIGSFLAGQIVAYRQKLGGYFSPSQLQEVYGMRKEVWLKVKDFFIVNRKKIHPLNLNQATGDELNRHPYLRGEVATAICVFRRQKNYHLDSVQQLREIELINEELFRKIAPYLSVN